ncbi:armadillo repeat only protein, partial [Trifolium medium]|nr:armadillo repeat only protein [Trifolium medium]
IPSIALIDPIVALVWELIASLCIGSQEDRSEAAACLVSLALQSDHYGKIIIGEGGVGPLLMLMKEGNIEGQKNAARAIGLLKV